MIVAAWVVIIGIVAMLFADQLEDQINPNADVRGETTAAGAAQVALRQNRMGHYVATGLINGEPVVFLVDTGATDVSIPDGLARRLGLRRGAPQAARTANGTVTTWRTRLDSVELGNIAIDGVRASINPGMEGDEVLLGMSFLRQLDLVQRGRTLTLIQHGS